MSLPKKIHYIWVGDSPKPDIVSRCIESWKKYMPDYEIIEWNEKNYDIHSCVYTESAYSKKQWAFVTDYMRFDLLNKFGGIYFDTDVELLKPIPKEIIEKGFFTGTEPTGIVSPGLVFACEKDNRLCKEMLEFYDKVGFDTKNICTVNSVMTGILKKYGYRPDNKYCEINGLAIYPSEIFCGYDLDIMEPDVKDETVCLHHYSGTWTNKKLKRKMQSIIKTALGKKCYKKLIFMLRRIRNEKQNSEF